MQVVCTDFHGDEHLVDVKSLLQRHSAYGIYVADGKILLILNPRSKRWEFPGGGLEEGEGILQALHREFTEETGLSIYGKTRLLTEWTELYYDLPTQRGWHSTRKFYLVLGAKGELLERGNGDDSAAARMVPINLLQSIDIAPRLRPVIELAHNLIRSNTRSKPCGLPPILGHRITR